MPIAKVELTGGAFQDSEGNVLANGYLTMRLSQDSVVNTSQICSGVEIKIDLDANGNVAVYPAHPVQSVWGNDQLSPANSFYRVTGYTSKGQPAWGPNNQQVIGDGGTFDVGTWVPNSVISWTPAVQVPVLEVNGVENVDQRLLNLVDTASIVWTDNGDGSVSAVASVNTTAPRPIWTAAEFGQVQDTSVGPGGSNNDVLCHRITISPGTTIGHFTQRNFNVTASTFTCAIYSSDGTTRLVYAGANAFDGSIFGDQTVAITPVALPAGEYYFAFGCTDASKTYRYGLAVAQPTVYNANGSKYFGKSSNPLSGGAMPASLGTIADSSLSGWPSFLLQP